MKNFPRRSFLKTLGSLPLLFSLGWSRDLAALENENADAAAKRPADPWPQDAKVFPDGTGTVGFPPGYLAIVQCATSETETLINIFVPRLKRYTYQVHVAREAPGEPEETAAVTPYARVEGPGFYHIEKLKITGLRLGVDYALKVLDRSTVVDERRFRALDTRKADPVFAILSCMCDDYRFTQAIDPMWERLRSEKPDFLVLTGDAVYVDSFEFVERKKATEADIWQRYVDAFRRIPLYHWQRLVPVLATWDDHDFGTNDGDRDFVAKDAALRLFQAIYGGQPIGDVWTQGPAGVSSVFHAFGQRFFLMDDRMFRQPNRDQLSAEPFGHWGESQHEWLVSALASDARPAWIFNGNQFFNGKALDFKEAFEANHPAEFVTFVERLRAVNAPVVFASGDIHFSEIMRVPRERLGYETYEFTSSSMHSYTGSGWENPMRLDGAYALDFNFLLVRSRAAAAGLAIDVKCLGLAPTPYFETSVSVRRE